LAGTDDRLRLWENARFGPAKTPQVGREGRREGGREGGRKEGRKERRVRRGEWEERRKKCEEKA